MVSRRGFLKVAGAVTTSQIKQAPKIAIKNKKKKLLSTASDAIRDTEMLKKNKPITRRNLLKKSAKRITLKVGAKPKKTLSTLKKGLSLANPTAQISKVIKKQQGSLPKVSKFLGSLTGYSRKTPILRYKKKVDSHTRVVNGKKIKVKAYDRDHENLKIKKRNTEVAEQNSKLRQGESGFRKFRYIVSPTTSLLRELRGTINTINRIKRQKNKLFNKSKNSLLYKKEVKSYFRKTKKGVTRVKKHLRKENNTLAKVGTGATGLGLGLGLAGIIYNRKALQTIAFSGAVPDISALKNSILKIPFSKAIYRKGMNKTMEEAVSLSKNIPVPKIKDPKKPVTMVFGGFSGKGNNARIEGRGLKGGVGLSRRSKKDMGNILVHEMQEFQPEVPLDLKKVTNYVDTQMSLLNDKYPNISSELKRNIRIARKNEGIKMYQKPGEDKKIVKSINELISDTYFKKHQNPEVKLALAKVIKLKETYPDVKLNLIGFSGGGLVANELSEHLAKLGVKNKTMTLGSPDIGLFKLDKKNNIGIIGEKDTLMNKMPIFNRKVVKGGIDHDAYDYLTDPEVKKLFNEFLF